MKVWLKVSASAAAALAIVVLVLAMAKVRMDARYFAGYSSGAPLDVRVESQGDTPSYVRTHFYYKGWRGEEVPALLAMPAERKGAAPCVVFLHGIGQDKSFLDEIAGPFAEAGFAFVSFDQHTRGERRLAGKSFIAEARAFRLRPAYTVNDTRRMIDYLETRPDIAADRIYLVGASYGAITGATAAAFDDRLKAAVLIYGGGNLSELLKAREIAAEVGGWQPLLRLVGWYFFGPADPVRHIGDISPRPVYLQNGKEDSLISVSAAKALQEAAREPKKIQWYEGDHIGLDEATVEQVLQDVLEYLLKVDADVVIS